MITNMIDTGIKNHPLADYTTLKIGGNAEIAYFPKNADELIAIRNDLVKAGVEITIVGAGSNLLISSQGVSGAVIFTTEIRGYEFLSENTIKVASGTKSTMLAKALHEHGLSGLEFLVGIPGTVGGAVTMNSSAHGQVIEDTIKEADILNLDTGEVVTLDKSMLQLDYRSSYIQKSQHLILSATFELKKDDPEKIMERMDFHVNYRKQNHPPLTEPNAGSTFRNPMRGVHVGRMIEELGGKEWIEGGARISPKHANFMINTGTATSVDISRLMYRMYSGVKEKYGYDLIAEIRYVGNMTDEESRIWKSFQVH